MLAQIIAANGEPDDENRIGHVVMMGSGEPLDNYEHSVAFLRLVGRPAGLRLGLRNGALSTCGLPDRIRRLAGEGLPVTLSVSLHAPDDETGVYHAHRPPVFRSARWSRRRGTMRSERGGG
jgi:23S rRNA (adenine2503-C2)-methyltransferase